MSSSARSDIFARLREAGTGASAGRIELERKNLGSATGPVPPAAEKCQAFLINLIANRGSAGCAAGNRP